MNQAFRLAKRYRLSRFLTPAAFAISAQDAPDVSAAWTASRKSWRDFSRALAVRFTRLSAVSLVMCPGYRTCYLLTTATIGRTVTI